MKGLEGLGIWGFILITEREETLEGSKGLEGMEGLNGLEGLDIHLNTDS